MAKVGRVGSSVEEMHGEVRGDAAVGEPDRLGLVGAAVVNRPEGHGAEQQREAEAHPDREDHRQLLDIGQVQEPDAGGGRHRR